jgi:heptose I phosphotransferase
MNLALTPAATRPRSFLRQSVRATPEWLAALGPDWADRIMGESIDDRFHAKQGRTIAKWAIPGGPTVYLKRHFELPRKHGVLAMLFPHRSWSPGLQEADRLEWAARQGLFVPKVVAAGEFLAPWGKLQSFLAVEELTGMLALHEAMATAKANMSPADFAIWKRGLIAEMARMARELHRRRAFHKDLYLCHYFVHEADLSRVPVDWTGRVALIDFHRLGRYSFLWAKWQAKDLAQLLYSTFDVPGITARDRVRFWKLYTDGDWGGVTKLPRIVRYTAAIKAERYYRHNQKLLAKAEAA